MGSSPHGERTMVEGVEASQTKGWAPWPTGHHVAEEENRRKEEEEKNKMN